MAKHFSVLIASNEINHGFETNYFVYRLFVEREDTHKKSVFFSGGTLRFYPPYTNGLVVHFFFFSLVIA